MDPALQELLDGDPSAEIEALIKLKEPQTIPARVRPVVRFGTILTCRIERRNIREVWSDPSVVSCKAPRLLVSETGLVVSGELQTLDTQQTDLRRPSDLGITGRGVIVGFVDVGCDFAHPNFRRPDGSTRLLALWDQSGSNPSGAEPYGYGKIFHQDQINDALQSARPYETLAYHPSKADPQGLGAHGTLAMDIAAGNGRARGSPLGIAPEADLIFVHVSAGSLGGEVTLGDSVRLLEALDFINRTAGGAPYIVNVSLGRRGGPHDGLTLVEQAMDVLLLEAPGRAICMSTGNYYGSQAHASGALRPGETRTLTWLIDPADVTPNELEIWYSGKDTFGFEVHAPNGSGSFCATLGEDCAIEIAGRSVGHLYHRARDPNNADHHIDLFLKPPAPGGAWRVTIVGTDVVDGRFNAWVERDAPCPRCDSRFGPGDVDPSGTTGTICNGFRTIAVGAFDAHSPLHEIAPFSSSGPTRDFRQKPDLVAPGLQVLGARSAPKDTVPDPVWLTRMSGTSFAAPHVSGTIALMFEAARRPLRIEETRRLLLTAARPSGKQRDVPRIGSGYLDVERAVTLTLEADSAGGTHAVKCVEKKRVTPTAKTFLRALADLDCERQFAEQQMTDEWIPFGGPVSGPEANLDSGAIPWSHFSPESDEELTRAAEAWVSTGRLPRASDLLQRMTEKIDPRERPTSIAAIFDTAALSRASSPLTGLGPEQA
jgi:subtilisin family serine protease